MTDLNSNGNSGYPRFLAKRICTCRRANEEQIEMSILRLVASHSKVPVELLLRPTRGSHHVSQARQLAMYLMHVVACRTMVEVGAFLGRDRSTVSHACGRVEDLRDSTEFDTAVSSLEHTITTLLDLSGDLISGELHHA
jgi:chromosomal replication initiation ATPase DnaA